MSQGGSPVAVAPVGEARCRSCGSDQVKKLAFRGRAGSIFGLLFGAWIFWKNSAQAGAVTVGSLLGVLIFGFSLFTLLAKNKWKCRSCGTEF